MRKPIIVNPMQATEDQVEDRYLWVTPWLMQRAAERTLPARASLQAHRVLALDEMGQVHHADHAEVTHAGRIIGVSKTSALAGQDVQVAVGGIVRNGGWEMTPSAAVWLGPDGTLTQQIPQPPTARFQVLVGVALDPQRVELRFGDPIIFP